MSAPSIQNDGPQAGVRRLRNWHVKLGDFLCIDYDDEGQDFRPHIGSARCGPWVVSRAGHDDYYRDGDKQLPSDICCWYCWRAGYFNAKSRFRWFAALSSHILSKHADKFAAEPYAGGARGAGWRSRSRERSQRRSTAGSSWGGFSVEGSRSSRAARSAISLDDVSRIPTQVLEGELARRRAAGRERRRAKRDEHWSSSASR